jgi:hypothetical protein
MNEYLRAFQDITQSAEQLLTDEHNSLEIKQSATSLRKSVQPCIEELKQSATKLKGLVHGCFNDLYHAEDVWHSKPRIAQAAKHEIWEQLGEMSGRSIKIRHLANQCKIEAIKRANQSLDERIEFLRKKWFIDSKGNSRKGIGFGDKEGFIKQFYPKFDYQYDEMNRILKTGLGLVYQEILSIQVESIQCSVSLLDNRNKSHYSNQIDFLISELETKFTEPTKHLPNSLIDFKSAIKPDVKALVDKGWGDIYWEDVVKFKDKVYSKIEKFITEIFDDRVKLVTEALEQVLAFYNDFLERQERYQQETPEQRQAEKAWIDQQRRELEQVQHGIEAILNAS